MLNETKNERENEMTFQFDDFDAQIQSEELVDERVSDEDLESAAELYDELEFELDALEIELEDLDAETRLADTEWDEHWEAMDMELLDVNGELHDYDEDE